MWGLSCAKLVLVWMASLQPPTSVAWSSTYTETAAATCAACEDGSRCAAVLTAIGYYESRFNPRPCGVGGDCDRGQSVGVWQISKYWLGPEGAGSTVWFQAFTAARLVRQSFSICRGRPIDERLGWYAVGGGLCGGAAQSRSRMRLARALLEQ